MLNALSCSPAFGYVARLSLSLSLIVLLAVSVSFARPEPSGVFPQKPVKLVVYTKPGGLIDVTARKIAQLLESKYVTHPVVVENKHGAGGIVALQHVSRQRPDGHTVLALTNSVISKLVATKQQRHLDRIEFLSRVVDDYECLIVRKDSPFASLEALIADAKARPGQQLWVGPASGGTDHLFALKVWDAVGASGKWIPYRSGGEAIAALLGKHGEVYVGNPQDVKGRPDLKVLAVTAPQPLEAFPDVPTFASFGFEQLTGESLWRGFALPKGVKPEIKAEWQRLFAELYQDAEWQKFVSEGAALAIHEESEALSKLVTEQLERDKVLFLKLSS